MTRRIHTKPTVCSTIIPISIVRPISSCQSSFMCSGLMSDSPMPSTGGSASSTKPVMRPCAEWTRTCRWILNRSRTTCERFSRISERFPPDSRWMVTAVMKNLTSSSGTRVARPFSASRSGRPKFCCSNTFLNSGPTGARISSATIPRPVWNACPALMARDSRSSASGNSSSNFLIRLDLRCMSQNVGIEAPARAMTSASSG